MNCAIVDENGKVVNMIVADPLRDAPGRGFTLVSIPADKGVDQRWVLDVDGRTLQPSPEHQAELDADAAKPPRKR